jgi:hypothetical protein
MITRFLQEATIVGAAILTGIVSAFFILVFCSAVAGFARSF